MDALAWIRKHRIALEGANAGAVPSLAHEIGGPFKGSWWSHPKGKAIFAAASALQDSDEVLTLKLIDGKNTYVHRALWPLLLRVVTDAQWRAPRIARLKTPVRAALERLESEGVLEHPKADLVKALEGPLLVHCASHHTEKGHHEKILQSWKAWAKHAGATAAAGSLDPAIAALREAAHGAEIL
jgi:hypothetical protein